MLTFEGRVCGQVFWTSFVKGAARSATALFLASEAIRRNWHLELLCPHLQRSLLAVSARRGAMTTDAESIALQNARLSARGAVRKSHCVMTWLGVLKLLQSKGLSPDKVLKTWNASCTQDSKMVGNKRVALLQLLHFPQSVQELLLKHASQFGERGAFMEDCWSNKKLACGYTPRTSEREWNARLAVTEASLELMVTYIHEQHSQKPSGLRCKLSKEACEEALAMSSLILSLNQDLKDNLAVSPAILEEKVIQKFIAGDANFELELQAAMSEKKKGFTHGDIQVYNNIAKEHLAGTEAKMKNLGMSTTTVAAAQLEKQEYELCQGNIQHDLDVYRIWLNRSRDREAAMYHQSLQHSQLRKVKAKEIAQGVLTPGHPTGRVQLEVLGATSQTHRIIRATMAQIRKTEQLPNPEQIMTLTFVNWAAPSTFTAEALKVQSEVMGSMVNQVESGGRDLGVVLTPVFCQKRGQLYKVEEAANQRLAAANICQDVRFAVPYQGKNDERERRPISRFLAHTPRQERTIIWTSSECRLPPH